MRKSTWTTSRWRGKRRSCSEVSACMLRISRGRPVDPVRGEGWLGNGLGNRRPNPHPNTPTHTRAPNPTRSQHIPGGGTYLSGQYHLVVITMKLKEKSFAVKSIKSPNENFKQQLQNENYDQLQIAAKANPLHNFRRGENHRRQSVPEFSSS